MRPTLEELMEQKYDSLPKVIQQLLDSQEVSDKIDSIAANSNLKETQTDMLVDEIGYVLFKITPIGSFKKTIQENLGLVPSQALAISSEVYGSIFPPIKKFLKDSEDEEGMVPTYTKTIKPVAVTDTSKVDSEHGISANTVAQAVAASSDNTQLDLDSDTFSHHDVLNEIENPTPSIGHSSNSSGNLSLNPLADQDKYLNPISNVMPEEARFEIKRSQMIGSDENERLNTDINSNPYADLSRLQKTSVHHDIVPNLSAFKPISKGAEPSIDNHLAVAEGTAKKLEGKLTGVISSSTKEIYLTKKPESRRNDPYREEF